MLAREQLDIVSVCTTARHRSAVVQDVARGGVKIIWAEKPMAISLEEADAMVRVCHEEGVKLAINCQRRWHPFFSEAKKIIDAGDLGEILQVTGYGQCGLSSNGSHLLDIVIYLAGGKVEWVYGEMGDDEVASGDEDPQGNGYLAFDNGVRAFVRTMACGAASWEIDIIGEKGRIRSLGNSLAYELIRLENSDPNSYGFRPSHGSEGPLPVKYPFPWPKRMQSTGLTIVEDLVGAIEEDRTARCSGEDGLVALEAAIAMRESHRRGGVNVTLPLDDRSLKILSGEIRGDEVPRRFR